ncbi:MAG: hypothetical protein AUJ47_13020 [Candidatus Marinimicrobia bacterium CG1_02_48_14]|nr:MAG: hypothetical protein AUJ47_13015 [Candidatus Marinimicrobia bacterium CG1_02_48_14]OIO56459.1 MAG: hypothetical protein AUJ47_13020 [Candidatus Marinimicrobia bacterium CG1_02_48_14]
METYYTYVLYSAFHDQIYIGQTNNLDERLKRHNAGRVKSTKRYLPWQLIYSEIFETRSAAMNREEELKSHVGRDWIRGTLIRK